MNPIVIIDYGMGNLRSVQKAFEKVGTSAIVSDDPKVISNADRLVLPGVGAFPDAIQRLRETDLVTIIQEHIDNELPFLGICLGLHLLFTRGHEDGIHAGLDIFPGEVIHFPRQKGLKVPHMGWNELDFPKQCPLFAGLNPKDAVYFVHSYYAVPLDRKIVSATADYPTPFAAAVWRDNVYATQFHPEKSQQVGLRILENFAKLT